MRHGRGQFGNPIRDTLIIDNPRRPFYPRILAGWGRIQT
jgi:hypothetical protein